MLLSHTSFRSFHFLPPRIIRVSTKVNTPIPTTKLMQTNRKSTVIPTAQLCVSFVIFFNEWDGANLSTSIRLPFHILNQQEYANHRCKNSHQNYNHFFSASTHFSLICFPTCKPEMTVLLSFPVSLFISQNFI